MTLYDIDQAIMSLIDPETGELSDYSSYEELQMAREEKIENTALLIKNLTAEARMIEAEEKALRSRRMTAENRASRLEGYLSQTLQGEKFSTARVSISYRKSSALEVTDISEAAGWLEQNGHRDLVAHNAPTLDKRGVTALIRDIGHIPGCEIVDRQSMQLR